MVGAIVVAAALLTPQETELKGQLPGIFARSAAQYRALDAAATPLRKGKMATRKDGPSSDLCVPHGWNAKTGALDMRSVFWWTSGHFPGSLWYLYEATGEAFFRDRARDWTDLLAPNAQVDDNHDVGFIMYCSYGNARRLLKTTQYDALLLETAASLSRRFNPDLGLIRSWGRKDDRKTFKVIPDNLMNLELLEFAAKNGGGARFDEIARAQKRADFAIRHPHMPADGVPYWDYGAPGEERDTSAASIMASGLLELAGFAGGEKGAAYRAFAVKQLLALASPAYFAAPGANGNWLLLHGVGHKPGNSEIDVPLDYGDYYFLEALLRFQRLVGAN